MLARNWAVTDLADALQAACDEHYPPTWDHERGEITWDFGLGEPHPRGQYNATMAAADAMTEGAWWRLGNVPSTDRFDEPTVCDVDFPTVALTRAEWDRDASAAPPRRCTPMNDAVARPADDDARDRPRRPDRVGPPRSPDGAPVETELRGPDLLLHTAVGGHTLVVAAR